MDSPDFPTGAPPKSPRPLHGPRPAPLRLRKDSHKIRKPPVPPPQHHHHQKPPQVHQPPYRPPVIIYTVSPKVIHTNPNEFMNLVQRLTGPHASAASPIASSFRDHDGAVSPAARFASLEKAARSPDGRKAAQNAVVEGVEINSNSGGYFPGILSPGPASLPPIPPNFFSPLGNDQNQLGFFQDLSPAFNNNDSNARSYNYFEGGNNSSYFNTNNNNSSSNSFIMPSPSSNLLLSPYFVSPTTLDLFNTLFD